jgi:methyltransferase
MSRAASTAYVPPPFSFVGENGDEVRVVLLVLVVFGTMIAEALRAAANERVQRARRGTEPPGDVYGIMRVVYPSAFLAMLVEGSLSGAPAAPALVAGAIVFVSAKALKWWAIYTLGRFWTFRVIVVPGAALIARGPYRWLRHPNYLAVMGELVGVALMSGSPVSGVVGTATFAWLLIRRISVEDRALQGSRDDRRGV